MVGESNDQTKKKQPKEKPPKNPCLRCRKDVTKEQKSVQCQTCQFWVHVECQGISDELFSFLVEGEGVCWNCNSCLASSARLERTVIAFEARLKEQETATTKTVGEIKRVDEGLAQLRREFEAEKAKTREAAQNKDDKYISREEYREREARKLNIIMHRVKEPGNEVKTAEDRRQQDTVESIKIFTALMMEEEGRTDIKLCRRIGERGQDPRPMVVVLRTEATKTKILEMAKNLRDTEFSEVGIVPDLTVQQRREEHQLAEEADRMNEEELTDDDRAKNWKWLVVGPRGAKKLIKGVPREQFPRRGRRSNARGGGGRGGTGANSLPLRGSPRRFGESNPVRLEHLLPPQQLLTATDPRTTRQAKRKEMAGTTEADENDEMEEETGSPARKK